MTQLLTAITRHVIVQVADTRTSRRLPNGAYTLDDDLFSKTIVIDGRAVISFTGRASALGQPTPRWAVEAMGDATDKENTPVPLADRLDRLADGATRQMRHLQPPDGLTFAGGAWVVTPHRRAPTPYALRVTNMPDTDPAAPMTGFRVLTARLTDRSDVKVHGQLLDRDPGVHRQLEAELRSSIRAATTTTHATQQIVELLVTACRRAAASNSAIGSNLVVTSLPRDAYLPPNLLYVAWGPSDWTRPQFQYLPADGSPPILLGPSFVFGNIMGTKVIAGPSDDPRMIAELTKT